MHTVVLVHVAQRQRQVPQHGEFAPLCRLQHKREIVGDLFSRLLLGAAGHEVEIVPVVLFRELMLRADDKIQLLKACKQLVGVGKVAHRLAEFDAAADDDLPVRRLVGARKGLFTIRKIVLPVRRLPRAEQVYMVGQAHFLQTLRDARAHHVLHRRFRVERKRTVGMIIR